MTNYNWSTVQSQFGYDLRHRTINSETTPEGAVRYQYSDAGELIAVVSSHGTITRYAHDGLGNLSVVRHYSPITREWTTASFSYDSTTARRTGIAYSNGASVTYGYDGFGSVTLITHKDDSAAEILEYEYERAKDGTIMKKTERRAGEDTIVWEYDYDQQKRLTESTFEQGASTHEIVYAYGTDGERVGRRRGAGGYDGSIKTEFDTSSLPEANSTGRRHRHPAPTRAPHAGDPPPTGPIAG